MNKKKNKILLLAYTNRNFGDDMFIYTICKEFPRQTFVLKTLPSYSETLSSLPNLILRKRSVIERVYDKVVSKFACFNKINLNTVGVAAVVYVIGGLFDDDEIWANYVGKFGMEKLKNMIWENSFNSKKPFFLLGCNVTRVTGQEYIDQMNYLFDGLADICFRDKYSYNFFNTLDNTRYAPDIVFNYKCKTVNKDESVLISVWGPLTCVEKFPQWKWAENLWDEYENFLVGIVNQFLNAGKKVTLLALCENEGDKTACLRIREKVQTELDIVSYDGNLKKIIGLFEKARFVVGTRFHSVVMALNAGCAIYPIVYESKTEQLLIDINYTGPVSYIEKVRSYNVRNVIDSYYRNEVVVCDSIKMSAVNQFEKFKEFIGD